MCVCVCVCCSRSHRLCPHYQVRVHWLVANLKSGDEVSSAAAAVPYAPIAPDAVRFFLFSFLFFIFIFIFISFVACAHSSCDCSSSIGRVRLLTCTSSWLIHLRVHAFISRARLPTHAHARTYSRHPLTSLTRMRTLFTLPHRALGCTDTSLCSCSRKGTTSWRTRGWLSGIGRACQSWTFLLCCRPTASSLSALLSSKAKPTSHLCEQC
jgi:hypothetical protein